jgi:thioredoxin 1
MALIITSDNHEKEVKNAAKPVVLDIYATWCGPCQQMKPILKELEDELGHKYIFAQMNVDEGRDISIKEYGVTSVPTFVFIQDGVVKGKETGYMSRDKLRDKILEAFSK